MVGVNRDDFAVQMDYVARLAKLVAPWALSLIPCSETTPAFSGGTGLRGSGTGKNEPVKVLQPGRHEPVRDGRKPLAGPAKSP